VGEGLVLHSNLDEGILGPNNVKINKVRRCYIDKNFMVIITEDNNITVYKPKKNK
jgi:hypothetical protein